MGRLFKTLLIVVASIVGLVVVALIAATLFFDPNDFRDDISAGVKEATGRDLTIDGDLSLSFFPWLAVEMGRTELGNAEGFSDRPFLEFDQARLSVRLLPLLIRRETSIGTASIDGLVVNLEVANDGSTNWDDIGSTEEAAAPAADETSSATGAIDIGEVLVADANVSYTDAQTGGAYAISGLSFQSNGIGTGKTFDFESEFDFSATPGELGGHVATRGTLTISEDATRLTMDGFNVAGSLNGIAANPAEFNFDSRSFSIDTEVQRMAPGEMDISVLGVSMAAVVEPFSYAGSVEPQAELQVAEFSLKELMQSLDIEPPATVDPSAMSRVTFSAAAAVTEEAIALSAMTMELDDSTMVGTLSVPLSSDGALVFDLNVDAINLDGYMAPTAEGAAVESEDSGDIEIPVDMIRTLNANGSFKIRQAFLSGLEFQNLELGLNSSGGRLRLHPLSADLYDGTYAGDVRIDASGDVPSISVNEKIAGVNLASLAKSMFDQDNITGTINGGFALSGSGRNLAAIRQDLDGDMAIELEDGAWEGTDLWHQMRSARALFKREPAPEPTLPARTEFSSVSATGQVTDGIFENRDLLVELPFLRVTGNGIVDLTAATVDYSVQARVLEKPELLSGVSQQEIDDFTQTVVPIKISGNINSPSIRPDIEGVFRQQVEDALEEEKEKLKDKLFDRLLGGDEEEQTDPSTEEEGEEAEEDLEEQLKKKLLQDLIGR